MQITASIVRTALFLLPTAVTAASIATRNTTAIAGLPAGATLVPMMIKGKIGPHYVEHNGTWNEAVSKVRNAHPEWDYDRWLANRTQEIDAQGVTASGLVARDGHLAPRNSAGPPLCCPVAGQWFSDAANDAIATSVNSLIAAGDNGFPQCALSPGPARCSILTCDYSSSNDACQGIVICNDSTEWVDFSCAGLGQYAQYIQANCGRYATPPPSTGNWEYSASCGQAFDTSQFHVIVTHVNCGTSTEFH